jgi:endonuclease/exonuclease/phosphatase family metal-dependent hydrolase
VPLCHGYMRCMGARDAVRVVTYNVYGPANPDWKRRHAVIRSTLRDLNADVVALQEVPVDDQGFLEDLVGPGYHFGSFSRASSDGVAGTLATRWPQRHVAELDLRITERSKGTLPWCATLIVEVDTPLGTVVLAHHKPSWPFPFELEREAQAVLAARTLEEHIGDRGVHAVVLGDFDATPDSASVSFWRGRRPVDGLSVCYQDAWEYLHPDDPGRTFDLQNPLVRDGEVATAVSRRIDYVLVRASLHGPTLQVRDCRRILDAPFDGVWASDHCGVLAELVLPAQPPGFRSRD